MQPAVILFERLFAMMLRDDGGIVLQHRFAFSPQQVQYQRIFVSGFIGRVEKDKIETPILFAQAFQCFRGTARFELVAFANAKRLQICANCGNRRRGFFNKNNLFRTPAERFDPICTGTRVQIEKRSTIDTRREHIEERFPQTVARRAGIESSRSH